MHDLHEAQNYLYTSTGTGPYNEAFDAITIGGMVDVLAENDVLQMTKRDVPGRVDVQLLRRLDAELHVHDRARDTTRSGASTRWRATDPTPGPCGWATRGRRAASGSDRTHRCPRSNGVRGTTRTSSSPESSSPSSTCRRQRLDSCLDNYWLKNEARDRRTASTGRDQRLGHSRRPTPPRGRGRRGQRAHEAGPRDPHGRTGDFDVDGVQRRRRATSSSAEISPSRTLADMYLSLQQFSPRKPASLRRHRLDLPTPPEHRAARRSEDVAICSTRT